MDKVESSITTGPYLVAALICERLLTEKDNVQSLIRIVDRLNVQAAGPDAPEQMPDVPFNYIFFLALKSGAATGPVPVKVTMTLPSGLEHSGPLFEGTVHFEGGTRGHNQVTNLRGTFKHAGPYWFNVYIDEKLITRTPMEVIYTVSRGR